MAQRIALIVFEPTDLIMVQACDTLLTDFPPETTYSRRATLGRPAGVFHLLNRANHDSGEWANPTASKSLSDERMPEG